MAEVAWSPRAIQQVEEIVEYIAADSAARAVAFEFRHLTAQLGEEGQAIWRLQESLAKRDDIRELVTVRPYRIIYLLKEDTCHIVAVIHGKRRLKKALKLRDIEGV